MFRNKNTLEGAEKIAHSTNIIGRNTTIKGDIEAESSLRIEGTLMGNLKTKSKLVLAPGGYIKGNLWAKNIEIGGTIEGKIKTSEVLVLRAQAKVTGNLHVKQLIVEVGAQFNGQCHMQGHTADNVLETPEEIPETNADILPKENMQHTITN